MSGFTWIQMMLLHLTAVSGQFFPSVTVTVRDGDEVTLPCENLIKDQDECVRTNWLFLFNGAAAERLVSFGQVDEDAKAKSDRLSVTENCSLVMKKVTAEDAGYYTCRQFKSGQHQDAHVSLSVVYMTEQKNDDKVTLSCSVSTYGPCAYRVKWLYEGKDVDTKDMKTSQSGCSVSVTFPTFYLRQKSKNHELFKCGVSYGSPEKEQQFTFSPQSSVEDTTTPRSITTAAGPATTPPRSITTTAAPTTRKTSTTTSTAAPQEAPTGCSAVNYIMLVLRVAELVLITVIAVLLIRAPGNQRPADDGVVKHENSVRLR